MTNVYQMATREQVYDEASRWVARMDKTLSPDEIAKLQKWMAEDSENEKVLLEMARLWDKMDSLRRLSTLFPVPEKPGRRAPAFAVAALASLLLAAMALWFVLANNEYPSHTTPTEYVYQTGLGEHAEVTLPDGSRLVLNTDSRIAVHYTDRHRLLTLERGEVYVDVASDKLRPLSVLAGNQIVQAVGTQFNVEITSDQQIELMVLEGKVKVGVRRPDVLAASEPPELAMESVRSLVAGESTLLGSPGDSVTEISPEEIEVKLSWRQGNLVFRGESLEDAVREIERYTSVEFVFLDQDLKEIRVAGLFKAGDVEGLLATLRENFDIVYQYTDEKKVLLGKNK